MNEYTEKDITLPTQGRNFRNLVKVKGNVVGVWQVSFVDTCFKSAVDYLEDFEAKSIYGLKKELLNQLNKKATT